MGQESWVMRAGRMVQGAVNYLVHSRQSTVHGFELWTVVSGLWTNSMLDVRYDRRMTTDDSRDATDNR
jgi:hypothetical protein